MKNANPVSVGRRARFAACAAKIRLGLCAALALTLAGCDGKSSSAPTANAPQTFKTVADFFPIRLGERVVRMQLAVHEIEQARGLMGRRDLGEDDGMLFVFQQPAKKSFYMRNTPTPLDIGYFTSDGVLREVYPLHPFDETSVVSRSGAIQFALEMNQGWYQRHGVRPGATLDLAALAAALQARGFELKPFGLEALATTRPSSR